VADSTPVYSIGTVAEMVDVAPGTLRTWEERYELVVPERTAGGHRLYSRDQIEQLLFIAAKVAEGMQPGEAHRLMAERMANGASLSLLPVQSPSLGILLAERDPNSAKLANYFLKTEGYDVVVAMGADAAEAAFRDGKPELAIIDLLISDGMGLALCRKIKEAGHTRILAVSTLSRRQAALDAGADASLQKPLDPLQLVSTVRDILRTSVVTARQKR
jgi:DNA-binding transcriptional MerR regulator